MAIFTLKVIGTCAGGGHVFLNVLRDGTPVKQLVLNKEDILQTELNWEEVLPFFIREVIKRSGARTLQEAKAAIESAQWVM